MGGRGGLGNERGGGGGGGRGRGGDEVCRGLVYHPEACVKMANTLFGKKLSDLTVVELKMELDKCGLSKKGTMSVLAQRLKSFGDHVNIAMRKKGKIGGTSTIVSATAVDVSNDDDVTRNNGNCDLCCKKIFDFKRRGCPV